MAKPERRAGPAKGLIDATAALLVRVLRFDQPTDRVIEDFWREEHRRFGFGPRERHAVSDAVWRVVRHRRWYEAQAAGEGSAPAPGRAGGAALKPLATLALDGTVAAPVGGAWHHLPAWLAAALHAQLGDAGFEAWVQAQDRPPPLDLRANLLQIRRDALLAELQGQGIDAEATPFSPWGVRLARKQALARMDAYQRGAFEVQDEGSQLLALIVEPRRGEMVADVCAGAGGKTLALAAAMRDTGRVYAFDTSAHRLDALKPRLARSGATHVHTAAIAHERDERLLRWAGKFDRVLVDAPCTGLGTLRRSPDLKWRQGEADAAALARQQAAILRAAATLVKPGGRLVYATCSPLLQENELVAGAFSAEFAIQFEATAVADILARHVGTVAPGLCNSGDVAGAPAGTYLRLWPHRHGTDGFFAAAWQRKP